MKIHYFQHVPFETPAMIHRWAAERGYEEATTHLYKSHSLPNISDYDALVVMGGPMGVHDDGEHAWLAAEKAHIKAAINAGKHVLGICLGAQLIADVLGANVSTNTHKEIGVYPIQWHTHPLLDGLQTPMDVLHWHGDRFEIPQGAVRLASSDACDNQAFFYNDRVLALQFHLEMDKAAIDTMIHACADELTPEHYVQDAETLRTKSKNLNSYGALSKLLDNWQSYS